MYEPLEAYLQEVRAQLKALPGDKKDENLWEIRLHLQNLAADYVKQGERESEAMALAIQQFGNAQQVGAELRRSWENRPETPLRIALAGVCITIYDLLFFCVGWPLFSAAVNYLLQYHLLMPIAQGDFIIRSWLYIAPFLAGWVGGKIAPQRAILALIPIYATVALSLWLEFPIPQTNLQGYVLISLILAVFGTIGRTGWTQSARWMRHAINS